MLFGCFSLLKGQKKKVPSKNTTIHIESILNCKQSSETSDRTNKIDRNKKKVNKRLLKINKVCKTFELLFLRSGEGSEGKHRASSG